jgi:hypothetical protein
MAGVWIPIQMRMVVPARILMTMTTGMRSRGLDGVWALGEATAAVVVVAVATMCLRSGWQVCLLVTQGTSEAPTEQL